jgi:hypothetical protein
MVSRVGSIKLSVRSRSWTRRRAGRGNHFIGSETRRGFQTSLGRGDPCTRCQERCGTSSLLELFLCHSRAKRRIPDLFRIPTSPCSEERLGSGQRRGRRPFNDLRRLLVLLGGLIFQAAAGVAGIARGRDSLVLPVRQPRVPRNVPQVREVALEPALAA